MSMIIEDTNENIMDVIRNLNLELYDNGVERHITLFEVKTDGDLVGVLFLGTYIWDSDMDHREYTDNSDIKETLETCLRREANEIIGQLHVHRDYEDTVARRKK